MTETANQASFLTQGAYDRLKAELDELSGPGRTEIAKKIEAAREEGDLKENGGYHAAKEEQGKMEARIRQLTQLLETAVDRRDAGRRRRRRARHGRDRRHVRRRGDLPARLPRDHRRLDARLLREVPDRRGRQRRQGRRHRSATRPPTASRSRSRSWPPSPTRAERHHRPRRADDEGPGPHGPGPSSPHLAGSGLALAGDDGAGGPPTQTVPSTTSTCTRPTPADDGALRGDVVLGQVARRHEPLGQAGVEAAGDGVLGEVAAVGVERPHLGGDPVVPGTGRVDRDEAGLEPGAAGWGPGPPRARPPASAAAPRPSRGRCRPRRCRRRRPGPGPARW